MDYYDTQYDAEKGVFHKYPYRLVAVVPYPNSTEGTFPANADDCPYKGKTSCMSRSGSNACGGFAGYRGKHVIGCYEDAEFK